MYLLSEYNCVYSAYDIYIQMASILHTYISATSHTITVDSAAPLTWLVLWDRIATHGRRLLYLASGHYLFINPLTVHTEPRLADYRPTKLGSHLRFQDTREEQAAGVSLRLLFWIVLDQAGNKGKHYHTDGCTFLVGIDY